MTLDRRSFLRRSAVGVAGLAAGGLALPRVIEAAMSADGQPEWSYHGDIGPDHWAALSPEWEICGSGNRQSPIDLPSRTPKLPHRPTVTLRYRTGPLSAHDNGHTINFHPARANVALLGGTAYKLVQFHYHNRSEHTVSGRDYPGELHFVHVSESGDVAVLGVFLAHGRTGPLDSLVAGLPRNLHRRQRVARSFDITCLYPAVGRSYRYDGSLTTPACEQGLHWFVLSTPIPVGYSALETLRRRHPGNRRPVQPRNGRMISGARVRT